MQLDITTLQVDPATYDRNRDRVKGNQYPCLICGKGCDMDSPRVKKVWLHGGGDTIITSQEDADELGGPAADLGTYPIGPDCYKKHKDVLEPFVRVAEVP